MTIKQFHTRAWQKRYLRELAKNCVKEMTDKIVEGKVPSTWDGHELRAWFGERAASYASCSMIVRHKNMGRASDYRDTLIVNNL